MNENAYKMFINGEWVGNGDTFADYNPTSGEVWAAIPNGSREDAKKAIEAAVAAQAEWSAMPHPQRAGYLLKAADILEKRQMDFVDALIDEGGGWIGKGMFETGYTPGVEAFRGNPGDRRIANCRAVRRSEAAPGGV